MDKYHDIQSDSFFGDEFACDVRGTLCRSEKDLDYHQKKHEASVKSNDCFCDSCRQNFDSKRMLMQHKKALHREKVNVCWHFSAGNCELGDELCWFIHSENSEETGVKEIKCHTCENIFYTTNNLMKHNKREHMDKVQMCKNKDSCSYQNCWFDMIHTMNKRRNNMELLRKF